MALNSPTLIREKNASLDFINNQYISVKSKASTIHSNIPSRIEIYKQKDESFFYHSHQKLIQPDSYFTT